MANICIRPVLFIIEYILPRTTPNAGWSVMLSLLQNLTLILVIFNVGGKSSGIFGDPDPPARQQKHPPGGQSSNIFGAAESPSGQNRGHPNKPKVGHAPPFEIPLLLVFSTVFLLSCRLVYQIFHPN